MYDAIKIYAVYRRCHTGIESDAGVDRLILTSTPIGQN